MSDLISVIVPVYNVEQYLDKCVESIINQTYKNLEIILVDDGSSDQSGKKCDEWNIKDSRIKVIHKENGGLSDARNVGLEVATGDYIGFVDSDDWIEPGMYERLFEEICRTDSLVAICDYSKYYEDNPNTLYKEKKEIVHVYKGREIVNYMTSDGKVKISYSVWKCLYKKTCLEGCKFPVGRYYEDVLFNVNALWTIDRVVYIPKVYYHYRIRNNSIIGGGISPKHIEDLMVYNDGIIKFYQTNANDREILKVKKRVMKELLSVYVINSKNIDKDNNITKELSDFIKKNYSSIILCIDLKTIIKFVIFVLYDKFLFAKNG